jgi:hypothetical protein
MKPAPSFADIIEEFKFSFGYIRGDIRAICQSKDTINYTLILLVGCACEMLAAARGERQHPEKVLAAVLEPEWKPLAGALFTALRQGLAHGFDTKHLVVDGVSHQIYMNWSHPLPFTLFRRGSTVELYIGTRSLAELICKKIDDLELLLERDADARALWYEKAHKHQRDLPLKPIEVTAWKRIVDRL